MNSKFFIVLLLLISVLFSAVAQEYKLVGTVLDKSTKTPLVGVIVILKEEQDSTKFHSALTDNNGHFKITDLKNKGYSLTIQNLSYRKISKKIEIPKKDLNLGLIDLEPESKVLNEVLVVGQGPPAIQKGDTTEMSSSAYKTNPDANAEALLKKMPGISVERGTVKAQGEEVKRVLVDGKQFFGDDPSVALKNLPADVIDKVQIFNKLSEQSELTGVDDGQSERTINIVTKQNKRVGQFGKITAGTDFNNKYLASATLNVFKGNRRITLFGTVNNVNQQNFSTSDLGGSGGRGGGNFSGGSRSGITSTKSLGLNLTDSWGKKINVNGSYFFNSNENNLIEETNTENLFVTDGKFSKTNSSSITRNNNHRVNMRIEYAIDSMNTVIFVPRINFQENISNRLLLYDIFGGSVNSSTRNLSINQANSYNISNNLIYRHKFTKPRRTISVSLMATNTNREGENKQYAVVDSINDDQFSENLTNGTSLSANVSYTEPITKNGMLMVSFTSAQSKNETDKETFRLGEGDQRMSRLDSLSNVYNNNYSTNRGGLSYIIRKGTLNFTVGADYQHANLSGSQVFPQLGEIDKTFENILPNARLTYKISKKTNLRIIYRSSTDAPSISQLQRVIDNSNRLNLSTGNPDLRQEYTQTLRSQLSFADADKGVNAFFVLSGGYTRQNIGYRTFYAQRDSLYLPEFDVTLQPGGQLSTPVNLDYSFNARSLVNLGKYVKLIKSNVSMITGVNYSQTPGYVDSILNRSDSYNFTNSLILSSNISEDLDFSVSYTSNYSIVKNSKDLKSLRNTEYWYQSANFEINWIFFKGFVLQTEVSGQFNKGLSGNYNENFVVWNASFGKKFLKNNAAELKLSVFDILNQNKNINRIVTASTIQDTRTNTFPRYLMLVFTYNLRNFSGQSDPAPKRTYRREGGEKGKL